MLYDDTYITWFVNERHLSRASIGELEHVYDQFLEKLERWLAENMPDHFDAYIEGKQIERPGDRYVDES